MKLHVFDIPQWTNSNAIVIRLPSMISNTKMTGCIVRNQVYLKESTVLYEDYNGIWSELTSLYWSTTSNLLVSRHPLSCMEEVISTYCPQCLTRYMEDEAILYKGRCPTCIECPECESILLLSSKSNEKDLILKCKYCSWTSQLQFTDRSELELAIMESDRQNASIDFIKLVKDMYDKNQLALKNMKEFKNTFYPHQDTLPARVELRTKRTLRCRFDYEQSKMSIMIQPKVLPLEGDSSMKVYRGKWWIKDSSAIHFIPRIQIISLPSRQQLLSSLISISHTDDSVINICSSDGSSSSHNLDDDEIPRIELNIINPCDNQLHIVLTSLPSSSLSISYKDNSIDYDDNKSMYEVLNSEMHPPIIGPNLIITSYSPLYTSFSSSSSSSSTTTTISSQSAIQSAIQTQTSANISTDLTAEVHTTKEEEKGYEIVLGGYEDDLLKETEDEDIEENKIKQQFHTQLQTSSSSSSSSQVLSVKEMNEQKKGIWCSYTSYNTARVSIPIYALFSYNNMKSETDIVVDNMTCQFPLSMTLKNYNTKSADVSNKSTNIQNIDINIRILFPI